jgi:hypothetical protein
MDTSVVHPCLLSECVEIEIGQEYETSEAIEPRKSFLRLPVYLHTSVAPQFPFHS